jgi:hypothetical protein
MRLRLYEMKIGLALEDFRRDANCCTGDAGCENDPGQSETKTLDKHLCQTMNCSWFDFREQLDIQTGRLLADFRQFQFFCELSV